MKDNFGNDIEVGDLVEYFEDASDGVINWGGNDRPRFPVGARLTVEKIDVHSWHTKLYFKEVDGKYNSVSFRKVC